MNRFARLTIALALGLSVAAPSGAGREPLPGPRRLEALIEADPALAERIRRLNPGDAYAAILAAYVRILAEDALAAGRLTDAIRYRFAYSRLRRGLPVEVAGLEDLPFGPHEKTVYDLSAEVFFGNVKVGYVLMQMSPSVVAEGQLKHHLSAQIVIEKYQPGKRIQEIDVDAQTLLIAKADSRVLDSGGNVTDKYTDTYDHQAHTSTRTRDGQAPVTTTYPADAIATVHAWAVYFMRARGVDVGSSYKFALLDEDGPITVTVTRRVSMGGETVLEATSTPDKLKCWFRIDASRVAKKIVLKTQMAAQPPDYLATRTVTFDLKSYQP